MLEGAANLPELGGSSDVTPAAAMSGALPGGEGLPVEEAFRTGICELSAQTPVADSFDPGWLEISTNAGLTLLAAFAFILLLKDIFRLAPAIGNCLVRYRANISLEHSLSQARERNLVAALALLTVCLMADKFGFYSPDFLELIPREWRVPAILGIALMYQGLRRMLHLWIHPKRIDSETQRAVQSSMVNYFLAMMSVLLVAVGGSILFGAGDNVIRTSAAILSVSFFIFGCVRKAQILASSCSFLATFLYLCVLEFLPASLLIASGAF